MPKNTSLTVTAKTEKECLEYGAITHDLPIDFLKDILISIEEVNSKKLGYYRFGDSNEKNILIG
jgi:hypothetical protein